MTMLKTAALAIVAVIGTASAASAAQYAWADQNAKVRQHHFNGSNTVNWIQDGQKVQVIGQWNNWYKIKIPGQDGWVKANVLDFAPVPDFPVNGGSFCVNGKNASFCINAGF
jgi:uncharacterized protein YgiM (DUF1202 family)